MPINEGYSRDLEPTVKFLAVTGCPALGERRAVRAIEGSSTRRAR